MAKTSKPKFDPEAFLAQADGGVTIAKYRKGQIVFRQGDPADALNAPSYKTLFSILFRACPLPLFRTMKHSPLRNSLV